MDAEDYDGIPVKFKKTMHSQNHAHISPLEGKHTFCKIPHGKTRQKIVPSFNGIEVCTICRHKKAEWPEFIRRAFDQIHSKATAV